MRPTVRRCLAALLCTAGLLLAGVGVTRSVTAARAESALSAPLPPVPFEARPAPYRRPGTPVARPTAPVRLDLPSIGVHASVAPVGVDRGGGLAVPDDPAVVGWWADGGRLAEPGAALVLDGHVDTAAQGPGALFHLPDLAAGDELSVTGADGGPRRFRVAGVRAYPKSALPPEVFRTPGRLVIVTCGGPFDRRALQYTQNVVAYADPV